MIGSRKSLRLLATGLAVFFAPIVARADSRGEPATPSTAAPNVPAAPSPTATAGDTSSASAPAAAPTNPTPAAEVPASAPLAHGAAAPAEPTLADAPSVKPPKEAPFQIDPIADGALIGAGAGFAGILELIISTGEIRPQRPVDPNALLGIDSGAVSQTFDSAANGRSNAILYTTLAYAAVDPILSGIRDGGKAALIDAMLYAEALSMTVALTDLAKIAVRRPRPSAYVAQAQLDKEFGANGPSITATDQSLSFFSGHAALCAATSATATYLAFARAPGTWRPWVTLVVGTLLTTAVSIERVRAGAHFPTDVLAGAVAGAGVGIIVPHLHRRPSGDGRSSWFGLQTLPGGLGATFQGIF
jgi:membrane-associated phospholipid phosphatase